MAEYIDRQAAVDALARLCKRVCEYSEKQRQYMCGACPLGDAFTVIEDDLPAADVRPVVSCKDCVYSVKWYKDKLICYLWNEHDGNSVFEDGFCNYGKKGEES